MGTPSHPHRLSGYKREQPKGLSLRRNTHPKPNPAMRLVAHGWIVAVLAARSSRSEEEACNSGLEALKPVLNEGLLFPAPKWARVSSDGVFVFGSVRFVLSPRAQQSRIVRMAVRRYEELLRSLEGRKAEVGIQLELAETASLDDAPQLSSFKDGGEAYSLSFEARGGVINSTRVWGLLRGLATLRQLAFAGHSGLCGLSATIEDEPSFVWRGVLVDTGRRYYPLAFWARLLDAMERVKLNVIHWHATDDESAAIESASLPNISRLCAFGPSAVYSGRDVATIVELAAQRGIRIMPEFDGPAHAAGFKPALPDVFCSGVLDVTQSAVYDRFLKPWLEDARKLFVDDVVHIGGDEVDVTCWVQSPDIQSWAADRNLSTSDLFPMYSDKAINVATSAGFAKTMAWDDVFEAGVHTSIVHSWRGQNSSHLSDDKWLVDAVEAGLEVVTSHGLYLTAGNSVDADLVVRWEDIYDRDILSPLGPNAQPELLKRVLGATSAVWGTSVDQFTWDALAWPRLAVFAERVWAPNTSFTPRNYSTFTPRLMLARCRLLARSKWNSATIAVAPLDDTTCVSKRDFLEQCDSLGHPRLI